MPEIPVPLNEVPLAWYLVLSAVLFALGIAGFMLRRNIITVFMSIEDETGLMNLIIWKRTWERFRKVAKQAVALYIEGKVERADRVIHVCPSKIEDLSHALQGLASRSRDFR